MRELRFALLAAGALLATAPGLAQDRGPDRPREAHGQRRGDGDGERPARPDDARPPQPAQPPQPPAPPRADARPNRGGFGGYSGAVDGRGGWNRPGARAFDRPDAPRPGGEARRGDRPRFEDRGDRRRDEDGWRGGPGGARPGGGWNAPGPPGDGRPGWRADRRHDWRRYRENHGDVFHAPRYVPPRGFGYGYRRFDPGFRLQPFFYGQDYWIADPGFYDLPPVYGPYRWVRYYDDVLLIDLRSGVVIDVIRDFFW